MDETRQSPEQILKQIEKEEQTLNRGHLKIFFPHQKYIFITRTNIINEKII